MTVQTFGAIMCCAMKMQYKVLAVFLASGNGGVVNCS